MIVSEPSPAAGSDQPREDAPVIEVREVIESAEPEKDKDVRSDGSEKQTKDTPDGAANDEKTKDSEKTAKSVSEDTKDGEKKDTTNDSEK